MSLDPSEKQADSFPELLITEQDVALFEQLGKPLADVRQEYLTLKSENRAAKVLEPALLSNGFIQELTPEDKSAYIEAFKKSTLTCSAVVPAAGAASRQFQLLKTVLNNPVFKDLSIFAAIKNAAEQVCTSEEAQGRTDYKLIQEVQTDLARFWNEGIKQKKFAFYDALQERLAAADLDLDALISADDVRTVAQYILSSDGLHYEFLPKALMQFHSYEQENERINRTALEEHLRQNVRLFPSSKECRVHFAISPEHEEVFKAALNDIVSSERFTSYLAENGIDHELLRVSYDFQDNASDSIALDLRTNQLARDENGRPLLRKAGHGSLLPNVSNVPAAGIWLQNIDNILYENQEIVASVLEYKMIMAGLAFTRQKEIHTLLEEVSAVEDGTTAEIEAVNQKVQAYLKDVMCTSVTYTSDDAKDIQEDLRALLSRPIVIAGYVPLEPGQKGGGPFVVEESLTALSVQRVNTVEGSEFEGGQSNPLFARGEFFNPVNFFILRNRPDGSLIDLAECVDHGRAFTSEKTDQEGNPIKAYERPGLWNGSLLKTLQVSIPVPREVFAAVKNCAGAESLLAPLHQPFT